MSEFRRQLLVAAALAVAAWLLTSPAAAPATETKTLEIDANVNSPTFGEPITVADANHQQLVDLVAQSSAAIAAYDAAHPEDNPP